MGEIANLDKEGIVQIKLKKVMTKEDAETYLREVLEIINNSKEPIVSLVDISDAVTYPQEHRLYVANELAKHVKMIRKSAVIGFTNPLKRAIVNTVLALTRRNNVQCFDSREAAMKWLNE